MAKKQTLLGTAKVLANLNKEIRDIRFRTQAGLTEAALVIKRDSVKMTPIDTSNLRGSCFIMVTNWELDNPTGEFRDRKGANVGKLQIDHQRARGEMKGEVKTTKYKYSAVVAYSAFYAFWVHEMPANYNFNSGENQFLIKSIRKNQDRVLKILAKHARF